MNGVYTNGYGYGRDNSRGRYAYDDSNDDMSKDRYDGSQSRERRPGGYGGLSSPSPDPRQASHGQSPYRRDENSRNLSSGRVQRQGSAVQQIEDVLQYIKESWPFMAENECIPVQVALQLLDESSLGLANRYNEFKDTQQSLQQALRGIVNEHHQGFNSSIGTFHQIQTSIQSSQDRVRTLRESLVQAKSNLITSKPEYKTLADSSQNFSNMLDLLGVIEQVQQIPERLESQISEKRFLSAVDSLQEGLRMIRKPELDSVNALNELKVYLSNQEHSLTDILTEELLNHLFLKSPYCENRWQSYAKMHSIAGSSDPLQNSTPRQMYTFLSQLDMSEPMADDSMRTPESDTFEYIYMIVESLSKLGNLDDAVGSIEERMPIELFKVVEKTNNEIQQRHPGAARTDWRAPKGALESALDSSGRAVVLNDLLQTLYARFEAISEAHRVFHDVLVGVTKREVGWSDSKLTGSFKELWHLYQNEIRSLLHGYLSSDGHLAQRLGHGLAGEGNIFQYQRDKNRKCTFKMDLINSNDPELRPEQDEVVAVWQKFVPGLVSFAQQGANSANLSTNGQGDSSAAGHKLLVEPSVFNISCLLQPSVSFLSRLKEIVPPGSGIVVSTLSSFLNDFLINVFHPQLEESLIEFCAQSFTQLDVFQRDPQWEQYSQRPIFKGTVRFFNIITAFCRMLDDLTHDQMFTQLIITQINTYYDRCVAWYKALVTRAQPKQDGQTLKAAAMFAQSGDVSDIVRKLWDADKDQSLRVIEEENARLIALSKDNPLDESDLMSDRKAKGSLCLLYTSMKWLAIKLMQMRHISDRATNTSGMRDSDTHTTLKRTLTGALPDKMVADNDQVYIPLSSETATLFDGLVEVFQDLSTLVMRTLHMEFRCQIIQSLGIAFQGSYVYDHGIEEPDENIMKLVTDLVEFDQEVTTYVRGHEYQFITQGSCRLVDALIVQSAALNITMMNSFGCAHMQLNARVLYHNLLNIEPEGALTRSLEYLHLFEQGGDAVVAASKDSRHNFAPEHLKALVRLMYSSMMQSSDGEEVARASKMMSDQLSKI